MHFCKNASFFAKFTPDRIDSFSAAVEFRKTDIDKV